MCVRTSGARILLKLCPDGLLDMGEAIADGAGEFVSDMADGAKKVCDAVGDAVGKTAKNISSGVKSAGIH